MVIPLPNSTMGILALASELGVSGLWPPCPIVYPLILADITRASWWLQRGNGTPLWCSCLENPRNVGAWWAAIYGVAQSRTRLKRLSSSSSSSRAVQSQWLASMEHLLCRLHGYVHTINSPLLTIMLWSRHHFLKSNYLFLAMLGLRCSKRASHCGGFSRAAEAVGSESFSGWGSAALEHRLRSCGAWA